MRTEQKIRNLAIRFFKKFAEDPMPGEFSTNAITVWGKICNSYSYEGDIPKNKSQYIKRLKIGIIEEALWLLTEVAIPYNSRFRFLNIESVDFNNDYRDLIRIGKQYFDIEYDSIVEYKLKKKTILVFEKIISDG